MADAYSIDYAPQAVSDIRALQAFERATVVAAVERHLTYEPTAVSRSSIKRMVQPFWSQFRLRSGDVRVYYDVDEPSRRVHVLRVLTKGTAATPQESPP